ncbi:hypothetical protein [Paraburkholderia lacunae]|nr:hypothetical protein [Paraburkholderia lacunae]
MIFGLLLSKLPHIQESRVFYDGMLALHAPVPCKIAAVWQRFKLLLS